MLIAQQEICTLDSLSI